MDNNLFPDAKANQPGLKPKPDLNTIKRRRDRVCFRARQLPFGNFAKEICS